MSWLKNREFISNISLFQIRKKYLRIYKSITITNKHSKNVFFLSKKQMNYWLFWPLCKESWEIQISGSCLGRWRVCEIFTRGKKKHQGLFTLRWHKGDELTNCKLHSQAWHHRPVHEHHHHLQPPSTLYHNSMSAHTKYRFKWYTWFMYGDWKKLVFALRGQLETLSNAHNVLDFFIILWIYFYAFTDVNNASHLF